VPAVAPVHSIEHSTRQPVSSKDDVFTAGPSNYGVDRRSRMALLDDA
jgi:hypothetical protein